MAGLSQAESRRLYSWWWDSHISPKNSKWLQENLTDMDMKVKSMIKLIEEDADSFARRAEMYYKKRPELMKLVEEFYRAYRALAERYDHATGALRQAHRTMAEAFPNQVSFALTDDSPSGSSTTDGEPRTPEMPPPIRAFVEPEDLQKDALGQSSHFHAIKRNGAYSEENDALNSKRGLKQLNEMFASGEAISQPKFAEGKVRKGLNFHEEEGKISESKMHNGSTDMQKHEKGGKDDAYEKTRILQDEVSQLFSENQTLKMQIKSEHDCVAKCESEILRLQESLSKLEADKDVALLQCEESLEKVSNLEMEMSHAHEDNRKLHSEMIIKLACLESAEGQRLLLGTEKQALETEVKNLTQQKEVQEQELQRKQDEIDKLKDAFERTRILQDEVAQLLSENQSLKMQIKSEQDHVAKCENEIQRLQESLSRSEADKEVARFECQKSLEKISNLEMEISHNHEDNRKLHGDMAIKLARLKSVEGQCLLLETEKQALEMEVNNLIQQKNAQQQELKQKEDEIDKLKGDAFEIKRILEVEVSQLLSENQALKMQIKSEHDCVAKCENEILRLQESLFRTDADKKVALLECQKSLDKISSLEIEISHVHEENRKLNSEMVIKLARLESSEGQCLMLETEKQSLEAEIKDLSHQKNAQQQELQQKQDKVDELKHSLQEEHNKYTLAESALHSLEKLHSQSLEKLSIIELELQSGVESLKNMEIRNRSLEEDIHQAEEVNNNLNEELKLKEDELKKLNISIQDEHLLSVQAEEALRSIEKLHSESQEELRILMLDAQTKVELLKNMELQKHHLEEEVQQLNERNGNLNEQVLSSALMIESLQVETLNLKEIQLKLENEMEHHLHEKEALQQSIHSLQEEIADLDLKHQSLVKQIGAVGLNEESFQASVKELQDGNSKLKDLCKMHEDEKAILVSMLENMEKVKEKNTLLEISLSDATVELEGLREKRNSLEESCESLNRRISDLISENSSLVYQLESITQNFEKLSEDNTFLENSLSDANVELEGLRGKLQSLEESSQSLYNENSNLQSEKITLLSQMENAGTTLENMKQSYTELEDKHLHLEQEKESTLNLVSELQDLLKLEQHEHEAFVLSSNTQLSTLADQMNVLREESQSKDRKLEGLQYKLLNCEIQAFILQRCLLDSKEWNKKQLESSRCTEKLLSDMKQENNGQKKMIEYIAENNKKLQKGIEMIFTSTGINDICKSSGTEDELCCQHLLDGTKEVQNFISDTDDENHLLLLEKSVITILLHQLVLDLKILNSEKNAINLEYEIGTQQLLALKSEKHDLLWINEKLSQSVHAGFLREDKLKVEMGSLDKQLLDSQERHKESQAEICILLEENQSLSNEVSNLRHQIQNLEEESSAIFAEATSLSFLSLILEQFGAERAMDLRICSNELDSLHGVNNARENQAAEMAQKIELIEAENRVLKDSAVKLEDCEGRLLVLQDDLNTARNIHEQLNSQIGQLSHQNDTGKGLLVQKDMELTEANTKIEITENENMNLYRDLNVIKMELNQVMSARKELEENICMLINSNSCKDTEIAQIHEANQMLSMIIQNLRKELAELGASKEQLATELMNVIELYEEEVTRMWNNTHISTVHADIFEEKMLELIGECESLEISAIVQRKTLEEQIILNSTNADQLNKKREYLERESRTLKDRLNSYLPLALALQNSIASLENQTLSSIKHRELDGHSEQDASLVRHEHVESCPQLSADFSTIEQDGVLVLQKLQARVEKLQNVLMDCNIMMGEADVNAKSVTTETEMGVSKPERTFSEEEVQVSKNSVRQLEVDSREPSEDVVLQPSAAESSKGGYGLTMKDIQLDQSSYDVDSAPYKKGSIENAETDDQMLKLWETAENDCNDKMVRASSISTADDIVYHQIEVVQEKSEYPSEPVAEKELGVDKLRLSKKVDSHQDWNKRILERLASDAQRLLVLQNSVQELKGQLEKSEKSETSTNMNYDTMKGQLKRAEEAISNLVDINNNLTKKAEDCSSSLDGKFGEQEEVRKQQKRQVSDFVQRGSDKIVRLELELQKIQYILLKLDEECENRTRAAQGKSRVILRDYLHGRGQNYRRKRGHFCGCIRPKTSDD